MMDDRTDDWLEVCRAVLASTAELDGKHDSVDMVHAGLAIAARALARLEDDQRREAVLRNAPGVLDMNVNAALAARASHP